jgi:hypothetical protein
MFVDGLEIVEEVRIDYEVYNGNKKVNADELIFMDTAPINIAYCHSRTKTRKIWIEFPKEYCLTERIF